ncbi:alcohol acetyltransferase [Trichoderma velutinum]
MGSAITPQILRKLGDNEHFSSSRHSLGIYRCVTVSCRYAHPPSSHPNGTSISPSFFAALATVIKDQPMMRVGITGDDTNDAHFIHIPTIDLRNQVSVIAVPCQSVQEYEDKVAEHQGWEHDQMFQDLDVRPPWRITILRPSSDNADVIEQLKGQEDVFFSFHHALMDGTSGRRFHEMLLATPAYQGQQVPAEPEHVLSFPEPPSSLPEPQEQVVDFTLSIGYTMRTLWTALGPSFLQLPKQPIWNAIPVDLSLPYKTRIKPIDISPEVLTTLLSACREHSVTITALVHSLVLASLSSRIPSPTEAPTFTAMTPISLRPFTSPSMNPAYVTSLRCLVAAASHHFTPEAVAALRAPDADTTVLIWQNAQHVKDELTTKLNSLPKDDIMAMLKYVGDWFSFWRGKDGKPRTESWELSNIGVLKNPEAQADVPRATRMLFTNGALAAGPPIAVNVASVAGSKFTIGLTWQDAVVNEEVMNQLTEDLTSYAAKFHETGKTFV